jgi:hypothetical protein
VLAVVDHQQPAGPARPLAQRLRQERARHDLDPHGVGDGVGDRPGVAQRGQVDPPAGVVAVGDLLGQAGLAHAARADQGHQRPGGDRLADQGQLPLPADERGGAGGSRAGVGGAVGGGAEGPAQHLLLEPPQPGRGVQPELVTEPVAVAGQGGQRVAGPAGLGEGGGQQLHGPLAPRLLGGDGLQRGRGLGGPVQPQQQGRPVLQGGEPELLEPERLPAGEGRRELGVGRASPEGQRLVEEGQRGRGRSGRAGLVEQAGEALGVDGAGGDLEDIAGRPGGDDRRRRPEGLAQPDDIGLQRVAGLLGRRLAEHPVDEPVHRDDVAAPEQERGQQRPLARSRHRDGPAGDPDLERPQDAAATTAHDGPVTPGRNHDDRFRGGRA